MSKIGFYTSFSSPILSLNHRKIRAAALKIGREVIVPTLFGKIKMVIKNLTDKNATAHTYDGNFGAWLSIENGYWYSIASFSPKTIAKIDSDLSSI